MAAAVHAAMPAMAQPSPAPAMSAVPLRHAAAPAHALHAVVQTEQEAEVVVMEQARPAAHAAAPMTAAAAHAAVPHAAPQRPAPTPQPAARGGLFNEAPRPTAAPVTPPQPAEPQRPSLFSTVTGAFRRRHPGPPATAPAAAVQRQEPVMTEHRVAEHRVTEHRVTEAPRASVRQAATEEVTLDIPAFLRRQSS
jgi:cell division protein FtsZ